MPLPADDAAGRRDETLARTRRASRWITAAAVAAAVAFGTAFAHALPGHHVTAQAATSPARAAGSQPPGTQVRQHARAHKGHHHLRPPAQPPTQAPPTQAPPSPPPPPPVVSGGS